MPDSRRVSGGLFNREWSSVQTKPGGATVPCHVKAARTCSFILDFTYSFVASMLSDADPRALTAAVTFALFLTGAVDLVRAIILVSLVQRNN